MESFCSEALAFVDQHQKEPFLLYLPFTAVHAPFVGPQPWLDQHDAAAPASRRTYGADLRQMDDIIGRVMARLRERGLEENTLVFFFSDNGGPGGAADNGPLRGTKWTLWEGGIHVPFAAQWKGRIPAGRVIDHPVIQVDVAATALAAAGAEILPEWKLDGANLLPLLEGKTAAAPHDALYWRFGVQYAVRQGDWKLVKPHINDAPHLFNLAADLGEKNDLATAQPEKVKQLQILWDVWNAGNEPPRWIDNRWNGDGAKAKKQAARQAGKKKAQ
jgi:arylsulfatase A-like enzyme